MLNTKDIIDEVISLPIEDRTFIADSILKSINTPDKNIDDKWITVAKRRLKELRSGKVAGVPGEEVFAKINKRFSK